MARYFLAGALTWRVPKGTSRLQQPPTQPLEGDEPRIEDREEEVEDGEDQLGILPPMPPVELGSDHDDLVRLPARQGGEPDHGPPGGAPGEMGSDHDDLVRLAARSPDEGDPVRLPGPPRGVPAVRWGRMEEIWSASSLGKVERHHEPHQAKCQVSRGRTKDVWSASQARQKKKVWKKQRNFECSEWPCRWSQRLPEKSVRRPWSSS